VGGPGGVAALDLVQQWGLAFSLPGWCAADVTRYVFTAHGTKCCAPQLPRQFGEGEHGVFAGGIVLKTLTLFLKQSTKQEWCVYSGSVVA